MHIFKQLWTLVPIPLLGLPEVASAFYEKQMVMIFKTTKNTTRDAQFNY